jgi:CubicO group peptidase (beta-lactamase class C family)
MIDEHLRSMGQGQAASGCRWLVTMGAASLLACAQTPPPEAPRSAPAPGPAPRCEDFPHSEASPHLSKETLVKLGVLAGETGTDALVIVDEGKVVAEVGDPNQRFELMSVTKSVVSLVIGQLVDRGLLRLDQPLADFFPAWKGTPKEQIQLQHILAHTSGLDDKPTTEDIYATDDFVAFAVSAELKNPPGKKFFYSNRAANLLAAVVKKASGKALDEWARTELFEPAGIHDFTWSTDKVGNVQVMAGLHLHARDLARLGQLVLDGGRVCGKQLVSEAWIRSSTATFQPGEERPHGLLWWIDPEYKLLGFSADLFQTWKASGVPDDFIDKLRPLEGQYFQGGAFFQAVDKALSGQTRPVHDKELAPWFEMTWKAGRPDAAVKFGPLRATVADGWGGQYVIVYPRQHVVIVRLRVVHGPEDAKQKKDFVAATSALRWGSVDAPKK